MIVVIDFDGTCVTHEFPRIGKDIGAISVLKRLIENGHKLVLFTMRSDRPIGMIMGNGRVIDSPGYFLTDAVNWLKNNGIELYGVNENPTQKEWTNSPKAEGNLYIDDAALGCPLIFDAQRGLL